MFVGSARAQAWQQIAANVKTAAYCRIAKTKHKTPMY
jgi:hypothetical protein